jgi:hypothetical protein
MGVSVLSIVILLLGVGLIIRGIAALLAGGEGAAGIFVGALLLVLGLVYVLVAKGIWSGSRVARAIVTVLALFVIVGSVFTLTEPDQLIVSIVQILIAVIILVLLYSRSARAYFSGAGAPSGS